MSNERFAPPRQEQSVAEQVRDLRSRGWSDRSIARRLNVPLDAVRAALGLPTYGPDGNRRIPVVEIVK
jgi:hypothetical protein